MNASKLRTRESIQQRRTVPSLLIHDVFLFAYVGFILILSSVEGLPVLACMLFMLDAYWVYMGFNHESEMPILYSFGCFVSALMALSSQFNVYVPAYQLHCASRLIYPLYILYKRNKKYELVEWGFAFCWLIMKIIMSWCVLIMYWNVAGKLYSDWISSQHTTPVFNPWTNPPSILLTIIILLNTFLETLQSYYVIVNLKSLI